MCAFLSLLTGFPQRKRWKSEATASFMTRSLLVCMLSQCTCQLYSAREGSEQGILCFMDNYSLLSFEIPQYTTFMFPFIVFDYLYSHNYFYLWHDFNHFYYYGFSHTLVIFSWLPNWYVKFCFILQYLFSFAQFRFPGSTTESSLIFGVHVFMSILFILEYYANIYHFKTL